MTTPIAPALKKISCLELSRTSNVHFKTLLDPGGGLRRETAVSEAKPLQIYSGFVKQPFPNAHTQVSVRAQRLCNGRVAKANGFVLASECSLGIISAPSTSTGMSHAKGSILDLAH
jgi:hypothetical protein